ncbi:MAG: hypothetical protein PQJ61_01495 [Spirochaetales bacterium]|uniref:Uncharacterized protein n=1 Tax=Candidatus Thalassospirochaeta sargassi TaxID=3119039 RepID=A0AAJ1IA66_9SPIO|nr:hypothetical protein [Spirochaetales bacterium]
MQRLAWEGLVELFPHRSAEVVTFDNKATTDLGLTRIMLDTPAVQSAVRYGGPAEFDGLRKVAGVINLIHRHLTYFYDLDEHDISLVKIDF